MFTIDSTFPVMNAAGWCKDLEEVQRLAASPIGAIMVGSVTVKEREGNPGRTFHAEGPYALNSIGLRNRGLAYYKKVGHLMVAAAHNAGKPLIISGAGFSSEEYGEIASVAKEIGFDGFEINLGCPNAIDDGARHRIASFDPDLTRHAVGQVLLRTLSEESSWFVSVKVSPMTDPEQIKRMAALISAFSKTVHAVVTMNTVPNTLLFNDDGLPVIQTPDGTGWAGLSGPAIKPFALGQVSQWRKALSPEIAVWSAGGVTTGRDAHDTLRAGASVVQVGTAYFNHAQGARYFNGLAEEFLSVESV